MAASSASTQKTLFVVGAGASKEVEMPISSELKTLIANALNFRNTASDDADILHAIQSATNRSAPEINLYHQACKHICNAMPQVISIDNFIDQHSNDKRIELCGKLAIVRTILKAESQSSLFINLSNFNNKMMFESLEETWFASFWKLLTENCNKKDLEQRFSKVAFVIFNYDRCIEHYLHCSLRNTYQMSTSDAAHLVKCIEIYHPYGTVGSLPWQNTDNSVEYGDKPNSGQLLASSNMK